MPIAANILNTNSTLRPGDIVEFVVTARDPEDRILEYFFGVYGGQESVNWGWSTNSSFVLTIDKKYISENFYVDAKIHNDAEYHAKGRFDDVVTFRYQVLPAK